MALVRAGGALGLASSGDFSLSHGCGNIATCRGTIPNE